MKEELILEDRIIVRKLAGIINFTSLQDRKTLLGCSDQGESFNFNFYSPLPIDLGHHHFYLTEYLDSRPTPQKQYLLITGPKYNQEFFFDRGQE